MAKRRPVAGCVGEDPSNRAASKCVFDDAVEVFVDHLFVFWSQSLKTRFITLTGKETSEHFCTAMGVGFQ